MGVLRLQVRTAEQQAEWAKAERDEAATKASKERRSLEQRLRDADDAAARVRQQVGGMVQTLSKE